MWAQVTRTRLLSSAASFHIDSATIANIAPIVRENIRRKSRFMTDEAKIYKEVGRE
jgi:hypothetical protein